MIDRHAVRILLLVVLGSACGYALAASPCGAPMNQYRGVWAFSNGDAQGTGNSCVDARGIYGWEYQCVEFIKRFYSTALNVNTSGWWGDAVDYFANAEVKGLVSYMNGGTVPPSPDDILVFSGKTYGHVAIITNVSSSEVQIIEQNWSPNGLASLALSVANGRYTVSNRGTSSGSAYSVLGWLRKTTPGGTCAAFPSGFVPFVKIQSISQPNSLGERLVLGEMTLSAFNTVGSLPLPTTINQRYCGNITLGPGLSVQSYVPTAEERLGRYTGFAGLLIDPLTNQPFPSSGSVAFIPMSRLPSVFAWRIPPQ